MTSVTNTAFSDHSIRSTCIFVLYFNLIINALEFWYPFEIFNSHVEVLGCFICIANIVTIYKREPCRCLIISAVFLFLMDVTYIILALITYSTDLAYWAVADGEKLKNPVESDWITIFGVTGAMFAILAFKLYSAMVCYSYREDSNQRSEPSVLPEKYSIEDEECEVFVASYDSKTKYTFTDYPGQHAQYSALPPQFSDLPPNYEDQDTQDYAKGDMFVV